MHVCNARIRHTKNATSSDAKGEGQGFTSLINIVLYCTGVFFHGNVELSCNVCLDKMNSKSEKDLLHPLEIKPEVEQF